ncbi:MAG: hypothetical protein JWO77_1480 [Ilumatobacteraceae bacterium]|nr:hypothetical protein [Ilumatobacteraceae bacterium]
MVSLAMQGSPNTRTRGAARVDLPEPGGPFTTTNRTSKVKHARPHTASPRRVGASTALRTVRLGPVAKWPAHAGLGEGCADGGRPAAPIGVIGIAPSCARACGRAVGDRAGSESGDGVLSRSSALPVTVTTGCTTSPDASWGDPCAVPASIRMG